MVGLVSLKRITVGQLMTNCFIISSAKECAIVDPGGNSKLIINYIEESGVIPKFITATHGHFDHVISVDELRNYFGIEFIINSKEVPIMKKSEKLITEFIPGAQFNAPVPDQTFLSTKTFSLGEIEINSLEFPGHTPGSTIFSFDSNLLTGDTLFSGGIGRIDVDGSETDMVESLKKLWNIGEGFKVYPGHGEATTIRREKMVNT
ncbi:metallo-beta-lactamase family protein, partial [mine drainage metagenome]